MAPMSPSPEDVSMLQEILGVPRDQATILLEKYGNAEQAVNQYLEDPTGAVKPQLPSNQWEPADNMPTFRIDADDTTELPVMSRPPSRVDYRNIDASKNKLHTEDGMLSAEDMQDQDLRKAIAMSKQDLSSQETGVVEAGQQFGPANRPYYDTSEWAMTTVASSREIIEHPPPHKRQRLLGQPAFLRGSPETGYLAPLLNIYHNIPLAREALLMPTMQVLSYGYDPQWWSGSSDENAKAISIGASERGSQDRHNLLGELQCLMGFLDGTSRAYGSVDALAGLRAMQLYVPNPQLSHPLETWVAAAMLQSPDDPLTQIFTSTAIKALDMEGYSPIQKDLVCLEPGVRRIEGQTLVNMLDSTIWDDVSDKIDDIWIQQCADVFTMRLYDPNEENKGLGLDIPAIWYPDRYMYEYREITRRWRREMLGLRQEINQCVIAQRRCEVAQGPGKRVIKIRDVLEAASKLLHHAPGSSVTTNASTDALGSTARSETEETEALERQNQLQAILKRIDEKVGILEERKRELNSQIRSIASQLTQPGPDQSLSPQHKYYLQGLSTKPNISYIRRRRRELQSLIDTTTEDDGPEFEWWRIVWGKDTALANSNSQGHVPANQQSGLAARDDTADKMADDQGYSVRVVDEAQVIEAAKIEHDSIVLVYANDHAMNFTGSHHSAALKRFVEQDNRAFHDELYRQQSSDQRRQSEDTNTTIIDDIILEDRSVTPSNQREMTPMSTTSPLRDADGQPSPKRAKGEEITQVYRDSDSSGDEPPPYEQTSAVPQMQERKPNKIGIIADQLLEKFEIDHNEVASDKDGPIHVEHAREPLR